MDKRQQIINAALKLFIEKGFQYTSTANISKEAGVATGTLFLYFPSKEALINTLYKESKNQLSSSLEKDFPAEGDTKTKLKHLWYKAIDWSLKNNDAFRFMHMFKNSPFISNLTKEEITSGAEFAMNFIKQGIKRNEIVNIDTELLLSIVDNLLAATVTNILSKPQKQQKHITEESFNIIWEGISGRNINSR